MITGASTGIGAIHADRLARRGYDLVLVARNRQRLNAVAEQIMRHTRRSVAVVPADLADKTDLAAVEAKRRTDTSVTLLVNNATVASAAPLVDSDIDQTEAMIALNMTANTAHPPPHPDALPEAEAPLSILLLPRRRGNEPHGFSLGIPHR